MIFRFVSLGIFAIVFILVKNVRKTRPSFVPKVPSVETLKKIKDVITLKNLIMVRRDRKGPIIPLWDEEKRLCGVQTNSGKDLINILFVTSKKRNHEFTNSRIQSAAKCL